MNKINYLIFRFLIVAFSNLALAKDKETNLGDGPYIFHLADGTSRVISIGINGSIKDTIYTKINSDVTLPVTSHSGKHQFNIKLHPITRQPWKSKKPNKLFVISDPHGNLDCFISVLQNNNIINENYEWIFNKNHLMIIGDVFDRGKDVLPIFWLIYKLEKEAEDAGGQVSFLLGNHEPMVLAGDYRYLKENYSELAKQLNMDYRELFSPDSELGRWLLTRNTMQIIGNNLFVHAGLSKAFLDKNLSIPQLNEEISRGLYMTKQERKDLSQLTDFLYGNSGPIWYRGMVRNDEKYFPLHSNDLDLILKKYNVKRIIVGHTIFPDIRTFYNGRVISVNVDNKKNFESVTGRGIMIHNNKILVISDKGILNQLYLQY